MARLTKTMRGLLVHAFEQISEDTLNTIDSSYTEAGAQPGDAVAADSTSKLQPEVSAAQNEGLELEVIDAGMPGPAGVGVRWKKTSDGATADRWRAWATFANITSYQGVKPTISGTHSAHSLYQAAVNPTTQQIFVADGAGNAVYYPTTGTWRATTGTATWRSNTDYGGNCCFLPNGKLLSVKSVERAAYGKVLVVCNASGAVAATVSNYSDNPWTGIESLTGTSSAEAARSRLLYHANELVFLYGEIESSSQLLHQFASADLGATWRLVETRNTTVETNYDVVSHNGKLFYFYIDNSTSRPFYKTFNSGFEAFSVGTGTQITSDTAAVMAAWSDFDGSLYVAYAASVASGPPLKLLQSTDDGATWTVLANPYESGSTSYLRDISAVSAYGSAFLLHTDTSDGRCVFSMQLGGFTNTVLGSFGDEANHKSAYVPQQLPQDDGWSAFGSTSDGTLTDTIQDIDLRIDNSSAQLYYRKTLGTTIRNLSTLFDCGKITSGSLPNCPKVALRISDASSYQYDVAVYMTASSLTLYDENAGSAIATASVAISTSSDGPIQVMLSTKEDGANQVAKAWYKRRNETLWTELVASYTALTSAGATSAPCNIKFGHQTTSSQPTTRSSWYMVGYTTDIATENTDTQTAKRLSVFPYPLPEISTSSTVARLSMRSGPGTIGELYSVPVEHDYAVENLLCTVAPSPSTPWRSTDLTEQTIVFRTSEQIATRLGQSWGVGMYLDGCNFRTAYLEAKIGGSWTTIATYDAAVGFESVAFTRAGELIWPAEGANGSRFMHKGEFVDGYASLGGEPTVVRKIAAQNSGRFTSAADMKTVLRLDDVAGTDATEGNATLWTCRAFCVGYLDFLASNVVSQYRLRIPVQAVAESYYQIGAAVVGYVQPFGKQWSDGYSRSMTPNVATSVSRYGTSRTLQQGPARRSWTMSWQDGVALAGLETSNPDYYSATGGAALVAQDDVWTLNEGMLEEIQGGEIPVVALAKIPDAAGTVNQRDLFCYGRLSSEVQFNQVTGNEADDTFGRVESINVEEIK